MLATGSLGYLEPTDEIVDVLRSNTRALLLTNRGERVMHVDFGCNLREFLFEPKTKTLRSSIAERIKSQIAKWMPFLTVVGLFIVFSEDDPGIPDPGFRIDLDLVYGNIPVDVFVIFPSA